jgi:undecaprenol kinase/diacylglycerol kinase (ATP)
MKVHLIAAIAAVVALVIRHATKEDILFVSLAITLVWVTEMINTAIEKAVDLAMPEQHPVAKLAKDVAAGAVLLAAVFAVVVAILVFVG